MRWSMLVGMFGLVALSGCHARFKKYVGTIDAVRPEVIVTTGPSVSLGGARYTGDEAADLVAGVVNVVQGVRSIKAANRIGEAVDIHGVNQSFAGGLVDALGDGPPFGTTNQPGAAVLQVEVVDYGLESPIMGVAGVFNYDLHVEIYLAGGKKVYSANQTCAVGFGDASALSQVLGTVNNVKQLEEMTDREIQRTFENAASLCGQQLVLKIRQHASSNKVAPDVDAVQVSVDPGSLDALAIALEAPSLSVSSASGG